MDDKDDILAITLLYCQYIVLRLTLSSSHQSDRKMIWEGTAVFHGVDVVMDTILQFFHQTDRL